MLFHKDIHSSLLLGEMQQQTRMLLSTIDSVFWIFTCQDSLYNQVWSVLCLLVSRIQG